MRFELPARLVRVVAMFLCAAPTIALAQADFPTKPIRMICVNAPGGGLDIIGRLVADRMSRSLPQPVVFENRAGAGGNIATEYVARAPADGYTLLETTTNHNLNPFVYKNTGYNARRDFVAVIQLTEAPSVIVAGAQTPYRT